MVVRFLLSVPAQARTNIGTLSAGSTGPARITDAVHDASTAVTRLMVSACLGLGARLLVGGDYDERNASPGSFCLGITLTDSPPSL